VKNYDVGDCWNKYGSTLFRRQVGIGSESDCLLGQPRRIFEISASEAGSKVEKSGGDVDGEGECGDVVADDEVRDR